MTLLVASVFHVNVADAQWCQTESQVGQCSMGACDDPEERDSWIVPLSPDDKITVKLHFVVFADSPPNCANPVVSEATLAAQFAILQADYEDHGITFVRDSTTIACDPQLKHFCNPAYGYDEEDPCFCPLDGNICPDCESSTASVDPQEFLLKEFGSNRDQRLNVFIADMSHIGGSETPAWGGQSTFPWCGEALGLSGGIMINASFIGITDAHTLSHEIGHALGLFHTEHGVSEQGYAPEDEDRCESACTEPAACDGSCSEPPDCDLVGDLICDTPATPGEYYTCETPSGTDVCSEGEPSWGTTDYTNYMSLSQDNCWDHFTVRQASRCRCWGCDAVSGWIDSPDCNSNDVKDVCDISGQTSDDCDENGVPDECQPWTMPMRRCCLEDAEGTCLVTTGCRCDALGGNFFSSSYSCTPNYCAQYLVTPPEE